MHTLWNICVRYWPDAVLALAFALIVDLFRVGSRLREGWRWVKDKYAESSIAALNRRIAEQGKYRNTLQSYLDSDKASYLAMLRAIIGMLVLMCSAGLLLILERKTAENGDGKRGKRGKTGGGKRGGKRGQATLSLSDERETDPLFSCGAVLPSCGPSLCPISSFRAATVMERG
jgi:hypothetical protein